jgi:hypothetical protein
MADGLSTGEQESPSPTEANLNEEPAKLNHDVALRAVRPNSLFSKVIFSELSQNNPLVLVGFYQNIYHHASKAEFSRSHRLCI